jgi:hypothetical protein
MAEAEYIVATPQTTSTLVQNISTHAIISSAKVLKTELSTSPTAPLTPWFNTMVVDALTKALAGWNACAWADQNA